ncbi:hypothetical protein Ga0123461_1563 [Mariprofundus aestuarium]|uniref:Uncharacterized protein n=1 Tax=Mariprofundus aestuarium TaxID=1921086 RepID=A0A2K8L6V1_MARES|nr:hypothetical protein Ga0123461_1563 [Mariprofundus aestuarium]
MIYNIIGKRFLEVCTLKCEVSDMSFKEIITYDKWIIYAFLVFIFLTFLYIAWTGNEILGLLYELQEWAQLPGR